MNFIEHFKNWVSHAGRDNRLKAHHISLYIALFRYWNENRFSNPFTIYRHEIMATAKIGSFNTYTRSLKELTEWEYIRYEPSFDPQVGSKVHLYRFDKGGDKGSDKGADKGSGKGRSKATGKGSSKASDKARATYYTNIPNRTNNTNNLNEANDYDTNKNSDSVDRRREDTNEKTSRSSDHHRRKKIQEPGGRGRAKPSTLEEAQAYFIEIQSTAAEAEKFVNHFQSNGWQVGGRSDMKDWRAAARKWVTNAKNFSNETRSQPKPGKLNTGPKNYSEPL